MMGIRTVLVNTMNVTRICVHSGIMPSLVKIRVIEGRDLPAIEGDFLDCYVDIQLGTEQQRTETIRKTLDPYW